MGPASTNDEAPHHRSLLSRLVPAHLLGRKEDGTLSSAAMGEDGMKHRGALSQVDGSSQDINAIDANIARPSVVEHNSGSTTASDITIRPRSGNATPPTPLTGRTPSRPPLKDRPTTELSTIDIQTLSFPDGTRGTFSSTDNTSTPSPGGTSIFESLFPSRKTSKAIDELNSDASVRSLMPSSITPAHIPSTIGLGGELESLLGPSISLTPAQRLLAAQSLPIPDLGEIQFLESAQDELRGFDCEFVEVPRWDEKLDNSDQIQAQWFGKLKHYMIFTDAGKPVYSRHGCTDLINTRTATIQIIIDAFLADQRTSLKSFTAAATRFTVMNQGPLNFLGISKMGESEAQMGRQLEMLYAQIISWVTLPRLLSAANSRGDAIQRLLDGTDTLLTGLCDTFTLGSPSSLLESVECLRVRKTHRAMITNTLLSNRSPKLIYGFIVAGGKLVSMILPEPVRMAGESMDFKFHPGDLQLIISMVFDSKTFRSGDGADHQLPITLPGFNDASQFHMLLSFVPKDVMEKRVEKGEARTERKEVEQLRAQVMSADSNTTTSTATMEVVKEQDVAIILLHNSTRTTPEKVLDSMPDSFRRSTIAKEADEVDESWRSLREMKEQTVRELGKNGSFSSIRRAMKAGRPRTTDLVPGTQIRHFMYKLAGNAQFTMSRLDPYFSSPIAHRRSIPPHLPSCRTDGLTLPQTRRILSRATHRFFRTGS